MLFQLMITRLAPLTCLAFLKKEIHLKIALVFLLCSEIALFYASVWLIVEKAGLRAIMYLPAALFPQWIFYGFAEWIVLRCIWKAWSFRVWSRIFCVAFVVTVLGILVEYYWNLGVLKIFINFIDKIFLLT